MVSKDTSKDQTAKVKKRKLTPKQQLFISNYILTKFNGTKAAELSGYAKDSCRQEAHRLLTKADIKNAIDTKIKALNDRIIWNEEEIVEKIQDIAQNGKNDSDRLKSLELLGKAKGIFKDNTTNNLAIFSGIDQLPIEMLKAKEEIIPLEQLD